MYEHIDMKKTGILLKYRIEKSRLYSKGYTENIAVIMSTADISLV